MPGVAPFCGANTSAASTKRVRTSQATTSSMPRAGGRGSTARGWRPARRRSWPSRPRRRAIRLAPPSRAAAISSPVPWVVAAMGRCRRARRRGPAPTPAPSRSRRCAGRAATHASTGSPSGPITVVRRLPPPRTSRVPSPPSASGSGRRRATGALDAAADGGGRLGGGDRAPELVDGGEDAHGRTSMVGAVYAPGRSADDLLWLDATAQAELVRTGKVSARELVDAAIDAHRAHRTSASTP